MNTKKIIYICLTIVLLTSCDKQPPYSSELEKRNVDSKTIVSIGNSSISIDVLRYYLAQKGYGIRDKKIDKEKLTLVLNEIISLELYKQAAIKHGLDKDPATILTMTRVLSNKYQTDILAKNSNFTNVAEADIKAHYEDNKERYMTPERRRGAIISVRAPHKAKSVIHKKAKRKLNEAYKKASSLNEKQRFFGELAKEYSDDFVSKSRRGDIGWVVKGASINRYESVVIKALFSLKNKGDISTVVKGERGYYIIRLVGLRAKQQQSLKQVERSIHHYLLSGNTRVAESQIIKDLKTKFEIRINDSVMSEFLENFKTRNIDKNNMPPSFPISVKSK